MAFALPLHVITHTYAISPALASATHVRTSLPNSYPNSDQVRKELARAKAEALVVCALDEVAYLLNVRGCDVEHCPVAIAYALVTRDGATLFIDEAKLPQEVRNHLSAAGVTVSPYAEAVPAIQALAEGGARVWVDPARVNSAAWGAVPEAQRVTEATPLSMAKVRVVRAGDVVGQKGAVQKLQAGKGVDSVQDM